MKPLITLFLILAWRIQYLMMMGRVCPDISCTALVGDAEWKSVFKVLNKNLELPEEPPTLSDLIFMVARLGGYIPGKNALPPGPKVMWRGMSTMAQYAIAWEAFGPST
jgi:hypothetical protein